MAYRRSAKGEPVKVSAPVTDITAGILGALGVVGYAHKLQTGEGQMVDTSLFEAGITPPIGNLQSRWRPVSPQALWARAIP